MFNITAKYVSVFKVEQKEKSVQANLSTSKKLPDGNYKNMYWIAHFVGGATEKAKSLKDKDKIEITNGIIENNFDKEKDKLYVNVTIFDFKMQE